MSQSLSPNSVISHYRIINKIGAGGMGEVYLAQDTKLDRKVAIKFLNEEFSKDADKLSRFIQEAKAASALNHPNILTVYEIGEVDGKNYIATELIDGQTLREHLSHKESLQLNAILKIGVQVAEALSAAHQAGIIHRDIKPENIMLRTDGYAKVLDFGLAKLSEPVATASTSSEDATRAFVKTNPGMVMGTVSYMSPEQARGKETDVRTDIWSLGVVLYEVLSGKVPFTGETINHTIVSILEKEPLLLENVPAELQRIVRKSITKDVDMRYQSARDLLIDLKNLQRDLDIRGELERSITPNRESANALLENATQMYAADVVAATKGGQTAATQSMTTSSSSLEYAVTQAKSHKLVTAIIVVLLVGVISTVAYFVFVYRGGGTKQINSIAVLPFENRSGIADTDYLSDGLAESLIYRLSQLPGLKVSPTNAVLRYKGARLDMSAIARELEVDAIMSGRLTQRGDDLTISVELTDVRTNKLIWAEQYARKMSDLLATQREIANAVTQKLQLRLSGNETGLTKQYTNDNEAYQRYLKGRFYWNKRTPEGMKTAIEQFKAASEKDPSFALAYVGLADSYLVGIYNTRGSEKEQISTGKAYAVRALEIDPSLAEAHASLGLASTYLWDWSESEKYLKRAIEINPDYASARHWYSRRLRAEGRTDEAREQIRRAREADELSAVISNNLAESLSETGDLKGAIDECRRGLGISPTWFIYRTLAYSHLLLGQKEEALVNARKAGEVSGGPGPRVRQVEGYVQAVIGNRNEALRIAKEIEEEFAKGQADGRDVAVVYAGLGEKDKVFEWLEKDFQKRNTSLVELRMEVPFLTLQNDPRFKDLLKRIGLPG
jgi:serine/threonine-protein kinase